MCFMSAEKNMPTKDTGVDPVSLTGGGRNETLRSQHVAGVAAVLWVAEQR